MRYVIVALVLIAVAAILYFVNWIFEVCDAIPLDQREADE